MSEEHRPIVIRRKKVINAHHGGSWKIALADFMTALMALFLVLWLVGGTSDAEMEAIAEYFSTPLMVAMAGGDKPTASNSAIPGGGPDPVYSEGERAKIHLLQKSRPSDSRRNFQDLQRRIKLEILQDEQLRKLQDQLRMYLVPEGLLIQLVDSARRPMFERGSDTVASYMSKLLRTLAPLLNDQANSLAISGHTDGLPYPGKNLGYSNWELSTDRANASRRELMAGGLDAGKLVWIEGLADQMPLPGTGQVDPVNRRIELIVLTDEAVVQARQRLMGPTVELPD